MLCTYSLIMLNSNRKIYILFIIIVTIVIVVVINININCISNGPTCLKNNYFTGLLIKFFLVT